MEPTLLNTARGASCCKRACLVMSFTCVRAGGSPWYNIGTTYYDSNSNHLSNSVQYKGSTSTGYLYGTRLTDNNIQDVVFSVLNAGALPLDTNAVYFVLTAPDVSAISGYVYLLALS